MLYANVVVYVLTRIQSDLFLVCISRILDGQLIESTCSLRNTERGITFWCQRLSQAGRQRKILVVLQFDSQIHIYFRLIARKIKYTLCDYSFVLMNPIDNKFQL